MEGRRLHCFSPLTLPPGDVSIAASMNKSIFCRLGSGINLPGYGESWRYLYTQLPPRAWERAFGGADGGRGRAAELSDFQPGLNKRRI